MKTAAFIFLISCTSALAQIGAVADSITITTAGGLAVLKHCKVIKIDPDGVRVMHDAGMAKVPYEFMPESWLAASGINRETAKAYREGFKDAINAAASAPSEPPAPASVVPASTPASKPATTKASSVKRTLGQIIKVPDPRLIPGMILVRIFAGETVLVEAPQQRGNPRFEAVIVPTGKTFSYLNVNYPVYALGSETP